MIFTTDFLAYFFIVCLIVSFLATDALMLANEISATSSEFSRQKKAFDASEYLLWKFAPVYENTVQHHRINQTKIDELKADAAGCDAVKKEALVTEFFLSINSEDKCGSKENKTIVKRIVLCENDEVCILEVGV